MKHDCLPYIIIPGLPVLLVLITCYKKYYPLISDSPRYDNFHYSRALSKSNEIISINLPALSDANRRVINRNEVELSKNGNKFILDVKDYILTQGDISISVKNAKIFDIEDAVSTQ